MVLAFTLTDKYITFDRPVDDDAGAGTTSTVPSCSKNGLLLGNQGKMLEYII